MNLTLEHLETIETPVTVMEAAAIGFGVGLGAGIIIGIVILT